MKRQRREQAMRLFEPKFSVLLVALTALVPARPTCAEDRPNILWITAEDMSATLGCWGDSYSRTPNIDALARGSVKYTNVFATAPVCSPARSCLITGCYATTLGTQRLRSQFPIPKEIVGFPSLLRHAGYYCTNNVKTDYNLANMPAMIRSSWNECSGKAHWRGRKGKQPFFAVFNHMTSHQSRTMVWPYEQFQEQVQSKLSSEEIHDPKDAPIPPYYPDTPSIRKTVARYYDCVTVMDKEVGQILDQLKQDGLDEDTIVFFYSDHGSGMPRHKRALLDSGLHVPLLVRVPKKYQHLIPAKPGDSTDRLVSFVDFPPTVLSLCGIDVPDYMQGTVFLGDQPGLLKPRSFVYGARDRVDEAYDVARSVRDQRYLYIRNFMPHLSYHQPSFYADQGTIRAEISRYAEQHAGELTIGQKHYVSPTRPVEELYDVQADPQNLRNLAESDKHTEILDKMRGEMYTWILQTRDVGFLPESDAWARIGSKEAGSHKTPYSIARDPSHYPLKQLLRVACLVGSGPESLEKQVAFLKDDDAAARYWAAVGLAALGKQAQPARDALRVALEDVNSAVRIEAAGALARTGELATSLPVLIQELASSNANVALHAARTIELSGVREPSVVAAMSAARDRAEGPGDAKMFLRFSTDAFLSRTTQGKNK